MEPTPASATPTTPASPGPRVGVVLAAGAGRRMGMPKALVHETDGTSWLVRAVGALTGSGCSPVVVVLGARADEARRLLEGSHPGADLRIVE
ncbi:MAG: NTP transferase domain-containing protein, partial [Lapillicoccus sp.]